MKPFIYYILIASLLFSCNKKERVSDAYGNFTATEIIISAESPGKVLIKNFSDGDLVTEGSIVYITDTLQSHLKKNELRARKKGIAARRANIKAQLAVLEEQKKALEVDYQRIKRMLEEGAAPEKQYDDLQNKLQILVKQMQQVHTTFMALDAEAEAVEASLEQLIDLLERSKVKSPSAGTILQTYAEVGESVIPGKPLFKLADLSTMELKAYFSGNQLARLKLSDTVEVLTDNGKGGLDSHVGTITWIASDAEFTPKIIQTREERINLVYGVKIRVINDGSIRINMPAEVRMLD